MRKSQTVNQQHIGWLEKIAIQQGKQFASLLGVPLLTCRERFFLDAFLSLSACRQMGGFGASPIPLSEMLAYCDLHALLSRDVRLEFVNHMQAMDSKYAEIQSSKVTTSGG